MENNTEKEVLEFLENARTGARTMGNEEMELRLSRALTAFEADVETDIFIPEVIEKLIERDCRTSYERAEKGEENN